MLPSRAIARSFPSAGVRRQTSSRVNPPSALQRLGNGRQFGTSLRRSGGGLMAGSSPLRSRHVAAPIALGGVSSSRSLSLWGYGKKAAPEEVAAETTETTAQATQAAESTPAAAATTPDTTTVTATDLDLSSITDIVNGADILDMPEQLGYLRAIGLDYGWGPTSVMQWTLEHMHVWSGMGWAGSIMATAVLLRVLMFYPQVRSLQFNAVMQRMRKDPRSDEAMRLLKQGLADKDIEMRQKGQIMQKMLKQEFSVSNWGILWGFLPIPFTFGFFRILNGMTQIPVPSLESAGLLWFQDLTATDPYFVLPALGTGVMIFAMKINSKYMPASQKKLLKTMSWVIGPVGIVATSFLSAAVNMMAVGLGVSTLISSVLLNTPAIRRAFGLPLQVVDAPAKKVGAATYEAPRPEAGLRERLTGSLDEAKKGFADSMSNYTGRATGTDAEKAQQKRKDLMKRLEQTRKQQERDEFEKKYKGRQ